MQKSKNEKGHQSPNKQKRGSVKDEAMESVLDELTGPKRKNKLLAQNPDLEKAQNTLLGLDKPASVEKSKKRKREKETEETEKKAQVVELANVIEVVYDDSAPQIVEDEAKTEKPPMTDLEWLRARTSRTLGLASDSEDSNAEDEPQSDNESTSSAESAEASGQEQTPVSLPAPYLFDTDPTGSQKKSTAESKILKTGRLFIRNLVYGITEADLRQIFCPYGSLSEVLILAPFVCHRENDDQNNDR